MPSRFYAVIMAAGSGTRMGADRPKQFLELGGLVVLERTIRRFVEACPDAKIVTVLPKDQTEYWKQWCIEHSFHVPQTVVAGGFTRFHSVRNALEKVPNGAVVAIHDGVRPLVTAELIVAMRERMEDCRALIPVIPMVDTLKVLDRDGEGRLLTAPGAHVDRARIYGAQTPQMFRSEDLKAAYSLPYDTAFTDDASVAQEKGIPLSYIDGERYNIKLTTPEDLELAAAILKIRGEYYGG